MPFDHYLFGTHKNNLYRFSRVNAENNWFSAWQNNFSSLDSASGPGPGRFLEIHLKQYSGTNAFEANFSLSDYPNAVVVDAQHSGSEGNDFISKQTVRNGVLTGNLPWVLDLPANWKHPSERIDISNAYPDFFNWAENNNTHTDWYQSNINLNALFAQ